MPMQQNIADLTDELNDRNETLAELQVLALLLHLNVPTSVIIVVQ